MSSWSVTCKSGSFFSLIASSQNNQKVVNREKVTVTGTTEIAEIRNREKILGAVEDFELRLGCFFNLRFPKIPHFFLINCLLFAQVSLN